MGVGREGEAREAVEVVTQVKAALDAGEVGQHLGGPPGQGAVQVRRERFALGHGPDAPVGQLPGRVAEPVPQAVLLLRQQERRDAGEQQGRQGGQEQGNHQGRLDTNAEQGTHASVSFRGTRAGKRNRSTDDTDVTDGRQKPTRL
jgi:hypothetical protein